MNKSSKLLICDLDGTLVRPIETLFPVNYADQVALDGASEALHAYKDRGYSIAIASNQGGVEAGFKTLAQTYLQMREALHLFPQVDIAYFSGEDNHKNKPFYKKALRLLEIHRNDCHWITRTDAGQINPADYVEDWHLFDGGNNRFIFRKPGAGMLFVAMKDLFDLTSDETSIIYTGDRPEDESAAKALGSICEFIPADEFRNTAKEGKT